MTYFDAAILGILQGLTEFLPVSSSGHLVLARKLLNVEPGGITFEVMVHFGTLLAVVVFFRARILRLIRSLFDKEMIRERAVLAYLVIGTVPAGIVGLTLRSQFETAFSDQITTSAMLLVTGLILLATRFVRKGSARVGWLAAIVMGIGQAMAIMPGISRSGTTIAAGMFAGVEPSEAAEFSFLLAIPAILGATVLEFESLILLEGQLLGKYLLGAGLAFLVGLFAVYLVMATVRRGKLEYFAYYCFAAGAVGLYLFLG